MAQPTQKDLSELEQMIDRYTVTGVVELMADICGEKSQHILEAYQDKATSKYWQKAQEALLKFAQNNNAIKIVS